MSLEKASLLYEGKAKKIFAVNNDENKVWFEFKDDLTAFNAEKRGSFKGKGRLNCQIATLIFKSLSAKGINSHWIESPSSFEMVCKKLAIIPLEVVVRNRLAGQTAKKFNIEEGQNLERALVEFYFKDDQLGDPFLSDDQALMLKASSSQDELDLLKKFALNVNEILKPLFLQCGIELIDFKLEFGKEPGGAIILADEISPDSCRLWDVQSGEKMDKDRFRRDLGRVSQFYKEVLNRLKSVVEEET